MYKYLKRISLNLALMLVVGASALFVGQSPVLAADICKPPNGAGPPSAAQCNQPGATVIEQSCAEPSAIYKLLQNAVNFLTAMVGLVFVAGFIIAGFQYMTARDNASQVATAKGKITTLALTFPLYIFGYGILQWLIPGGIFCS